MGHKDVAVDKTGHDAAQDRTDPVDDAVRPEIGRDHWPERPRGIHGGSGEWPTHQNVDHDDEAYAETADLRMTGVDGSSKNCQYQKESENRLDQHPGPERNTGVQTRGSQIDRHPDR